MARESVFERFLRPELLFVSATLLGDRGASLERRLTLRGSQCELAVFVVVFELFQPFSAEFWQTFPQYSLAPRMLLVSVEYASPLGRGQDLSFFDRR